MLEVLVPFLIVDSDWSINNTPLTPTISPNTSNQNFEIAILFEAVKKFGNYVFEDDTPPTALRARVISYALGAYKLFFFRKRYCSKLKNESFDWKLKRLVPFLIVESDWMASNQLPCSPLPQTHPIKILR